MRFIFDKDKNEKLKKERGISFEEVITLIESGSFLNRLEHPNKKKYPGQHVYEVLLDDYIYWVPCVIKEEEAFLKTIYPSRKATKHYRKGPSQ